MITDRVIALIETHANMAGVEKAKAGFGGLNLSTLALGAALGGLILVGKDAIKNTEEMDTAHRHLQQAADATHRSFDNLQSGFDAWSSANKRYIANQYDAETALANFIRTGLTAPEAMRALNDALDLAVIKGISMSDAQNIITLALAGSTKGTKFLGISTAELTKIMHSHLTPAQKHAAILKLIEGHTKNGRKATTDLAGSTQALNKDWQDITTKVGPPLLGLFSGIIGKVDDLVSWLDKLGQDKSWNKNVSAFLGTIQNSIIEDVKWVEAAITDIQRLGNFLSGHGSTTPGGSAQGHGARAAGGPVAAGAAYTVGERGPETLVMGNQSGSIIPNGGGGAAVHLHIHGGMFMDNGPTIDAISNALLRYARHRPGR